MINENQVWDLGSGYSIRVMSKEEFWPLFRQHSARIFDEQSPIFRVREALSEGERDRLQALGQHCGSPLEFRLGLFHGNDFIGWNYSRQESAFTLYMQNSAVFAEHRRKGLYTALAQKMVEIGREQGFQTIYSRHTATNNDVIIAKLKLGFRITSLEMSDIFGVLVHLSYFPNELRHRVLDFRAGQTRPDDEIKHLLKL